MHRFQEAKFNHQKGSLPTTFFRSGSGEGFEQDYYFFLDGY